MHIKAIFLASESILPMARNELLNLSHREKYDAMIFIDDDEYWDADHLIEILKSPKDVIALPVVNKSDVKIAYNVNLEKDHQKDDADGYVKAESCGTGFLKLSQKVVSDLYNSNPELNFRGKKLRVICEYSQMAGDFVGEDISLTRKIKELGYDIWINPKHTVSHLGVKMYKGDFTSTLKSGK